MALQITLAAEKIGAIGSLPITNSLLTTWVVMGLLIAFAIAATRKMSMIPKGAQLVAELVVGGLYDFFESVTGSNVKQFFAFIATLFVYILVANWVGLLPGVGTIGFHHEHEFLPLFRGPMADLNATVALALVSVIAMQYYGFKNVGIHYSTRFLNFKDPIMFSVGILEIASDISKVISFAFRLFGNIFAGEVLLAVMAYLMPFLVPLPFLFMELFVGIIQALVFSMLTAAFLNLAVAHGEEESHIEGAVSGHKA